MDQYQDYNEYDGGSGLSPILKGIAGVAGVAGASAAFFHLARRSPYLSKKLSLRERYLTDLRQSIDLKPLREMTIDDFRGKSGWIEKAKASIERTKKETYRHPLDGIDPYDNRSAIGLFTQVSTYQRDLRAFSRQNFVTENVIKPISEALDKMHNPNVNPEIDPSDAFDENLLRKFHNFIYSAARNPDSDAELYRTAKKLGIHEGRNYDTARWIVSEISKRNTVAARRKYREKQATIFSNVIDKALDINRLKRHQKEQEEGGFLRKLLRKAGFDNLQKNRAMTVEEIFENAKKFQSSKKYTRRLEHNGTSSEENQEVVDPIQLLHEVHDVIKERQGDAAAKEFLQLRLDQNLRVQVDFLGRKHFYTTYTQQHMTDKLLDTFASTMPGKIFKARDIQYALGKVPNFFYSAAGSYDPALAAMVNEGDRKRQSELDVGVYHIFDETFKATEDGKLEKLDIAPTIMVSGKYGAMQHFLHQMSGDLRYKEGSSWLARTLDIGQDRSEFTPFNPISMLRSISTKFDDENYMGNKVKRFTESDLFSQTDFASHLDQATRSYGERARYAQEYMADFLDVRDMVKENVYKLSHEAVQGLLDKTMNPEDKKLLELLSQ